MTRYTPQWLQAGSYAASVDRRLLGALWPAPATSGCQVTAGSGMAVNVFPGQVAVPTQNNTGTTLCTSDALESVTLAAAPASPSNRIDLIICQPRGGDLDAGSNNDFIFTSVLGTVAASPVAPAVPAGSVALASVYIPGSSAAVSAGNITDLRPGNLAIPVGQPASAPRGLIAAGQGPASAVSAVTGNLWTWTPGVNVSASRRYQLVTSWQAAAASSNSFIYMVYNLSPNDPAVGGRRFWWTTGTITSASTFYGDSVTGYQPAVDGPFSVLFSNNGASLGFSANSWKLWLYDMGGV